MKLAAPAGHPRPRDRLPASTILPDDLASLSFEEFARLTGQIDGLAPRIRSFR